MTPLCEAPHPPGSGLPVPSAVTRPDPIKPFTLQVLNTHFKLSLASNHHFSVPDFSERNSSTTHTLICSTQRPAFRHNIQSLSTETAEDTKKKLNAFPPVLAEIQYVRRWGGRLGFVQADISDIFRPTLEQKQHIPDMKSEL